MVKRKAIDLTETSEPVKKKKKDEADMIVVGIDIGPKNMGLCYFDGSRRSEPDYLPFMEHSTLYMTGEGYGYRKFEEGKCTEMVYKWIQDRWESIFKHCDLVVIEKQMEKQPPKLTAEEKKKKKKIFRPSYIDRNCIMVEQNLKAFFHSQLAHGGPKYICKGPAWWKNTMEIEYGKVNRNKKGETHKNNKLSSEEAFITRYGLDTYQTLKKLHGAKVDDCIDAFWIAKAGYSDRDKMRKDIKKTSNHDYATFQTKVNISAAERHIEVKPITETQPRVVSARKSHYVVRKETIRYKQQLSLNAQARKLKNEQKGK